MQNDDKDKSPSINDITPRGGGGAKGVGKVQIRMAIWGDVHSSRHIGDPQLELLEVKIRHMLEKKLYYF